METIGEAARRLLAEWTARKRPTGVEKARLNLVPANSNECRKAADGCTNGVSNPSAVSALGGDGK